MKTYKTGLVVGKFWPPHAGHLHLIRTAASACETLHVRVIESHKEWPLGDVRLGWIKEEVKWGNIAFDVIPNLPPGYEDDSVAWADYTKKFLGFVPDAVFSSEEYGTEWAKELGCEHVLVDLERKLLPVSGTKVRNNALEVWDYVPDAARPFYAKKILLLGCESTGKTTLAKNLALEFGGAFVPEYGRLYWEEHNLGMSPAPDPAFWPMVMINQPKLEDEACRHTKNGLVFCDTDLLTTSVWYLHMVGLDDMFYLLRNKGMSRNYDLVLYLDPDTPFVQDGTRTTEAHREWFHDELLHAADTLSFGFKRISGTWDERFTAAVEAVKKLIES